jgi:hypothetical protein
VANVCDGGVEGGAKRRASLLIRHFAFQAFLTSTVERTGNIGNSSRRSGPGEPKEAAGADRTSAVSIDGRCG